MREKINKESQPQKGSMQKTEKTKCKLEDTSKACHSENRFSIESWIDDWVSYLLSH